MARRLLAVGLLVLLSAADADAGVREGPGARIDLAPGPDALSGSLFVGATVGDAATIWIAIPAGSTLRVDEAFVVRNPSAEQVVLEMRFEPLLEDVRLEPTMGGEPISRAVLPPGAVLALGLIAASEAPVGTRTNVSLVLDATS